MEEDPHVLSSIHVDTSLPDLQEVIGEHKGWMRLFGLFIDTFCSYPPYSRAPSSLISSHSRSHYRPWLTHCFPPISVTLWSYLSLRVVDLTIMARHHIRVVVVLYQAFPSLPSIQRILIVSISCQTSGCCW